GGADGVAGAVQGRGEGEADDGAVRAAEGGHRAAVRAVGGGRGAERVTAGEVPMARVLVVGTLVLAAVAGTVAELMGAAPPPPTPPGAPLPPGALFRLGASGMRHGASICGSALSPDGRLLATSSGKSVAVWDLRTGRQVWLLPCDRWPHYSTTKLVFSSDGKR